MRCAHPRSWRRLSPCTEVPPRCSGSRTRTTTSRSPAARAGRMSRSSTTCSTERTPGSRRPSAARPDGLARGGARSRVPQTRRRLASSARSTRASMPPPTRAAPPRRGAPSSTGPARARSGAAVLSRKPLRHQAPAAISRTQAARRRWRERGKRRGGQTLLSFRGLFAPGCRTDARNAGAPRGLRRCLCAGASAPVTLRQCLCAVPPRTLCAPALRRAPSAQPLSAGRRPTPAGRAAGRGSRGCRP